MFEGEGSGDRPTGRLPSAAVLAVEEEYWERRYPSTTPESLGLLEQVTGSWRVENRAAAAQLVAIGQLFAYRLSRCSDTEDWCVDTMEAVAAEVAAALRISQRAGLYRIEDARVMRERLPLTAQVFIAGELDYGSFRIIAARTMLITDPTILAKVDARIADNVGRWPSLTKSRLAGKVDAIVARIDADAVRQRRQRHTDREISIWDHPDGGVSYIEGTLNPVDARALDQRLNALAATVCRHDPRTPAQRRADAAGALAAGAKRLGCRCGRPDCAAGARPDATAVTIHVIAEQATLDGTSDAPASRWCADGVITSELLTELALTAKLVPLTHPGDAAPEPRYRPSAALSEFVKCRDLTCRFPGCDAPATHCDVDHTIPYADGGPTHAANLKCLCRWHHLIKTFWGWTDRQLADGTVIWTHPDGHTYITTPASALLFPSLCRPTLGMPTPQTRTRQEYCDQRTAMMPKRHRTRAQDRAHRINTERRHNHHTRQARRTTYDHHNGKTPPHPDDDPPPF